ncbi:unnamed protein product [Polarella glacialis]|uniref:Uncharacterized protein n=1 Tax=Polarella glacialis TaxID=89957 RepID=A0A813L6G7_POLGL|nr:unnamed protein product [Polarella glacialis]CAE8719030.1 unnamed protein product [Polarella glacialis]
MRSAASQYPYDPMTTSGNNNLRLWEKTIGRLEAHMWHHAALTWVVIPLFAVVQGVVPFLQPTCENGFNNWSLLFVFGYVLHHIYAESSSWTAVKELLSLPEITIMRQFGVLRLRRRMVFLGLLEGLDFYTDMTFPLMARHCDHVLTETWRRSWQEVPYVGQHLDAIVEVLRFWGIALLCASVNVVLTGLIGLWRMSSTYRSADYAFEDIFSTDGRKTEDKRIGGKAFYTWARSAETAMMPSVASLCEEVGDQKRWKYDPSKKEGATEARQNYIHGKIDYAAVAKFELGDAAAEEQVELARQLHYALLLLLKVFIGNGMSLWLQGSYFALTFETTGNEGKYKVVASMVISALQALVRCTQASIKLGFPGVLLSSLIMSFVAWSFAKVYYAFICPHHMWNLTTGCVL